MNALSPESYNVITQPIGLINQTNRTLPAKKECPHQSNALFTQFSPPMDFSDDRRALRPPAGHLFLFSRASWSLSSSTPIMKETFSSRGGIRGDTRTLVTGYLNLAVSAASSPASSWAAPPTNVSRASPPKPLKVFPPFGVISMGLGSILGFQKLRQEEAVFSPICEAGVWELHSACLQAVVHISSRRTPCCWKAASFVGLILEPMHGGRVMVTLGNG